MDIGRESTLHLFLREKLSRNDALVMRVLKSQSQTVVASIERCYSKRFEGPKTYASNELEFVGETGAWGNVPLQIGERALVFIGWLGNSERYYQDHWRGHFTIEEINGVECAIANWHLLNEKCEPESLSNICFLPDQKVPWRVALPFSALEQCLLEELNAISK